jgi:ABC-type transport system substrate-binding protein
MMIWGLHTDAYWSFYTNAKVDQLIEKSMTVYDQEDRIRHFQRIDRLLHEDASHIFLFELKVAIGISEQLHWEPSPGDMWFKFWDAYWKE